MSRLRELVGSLDAQSAPRLGCAVLGISSGYDVIRVLAGCALLTAAILTCVQVSTQPIPATSLLTSRPFLIATVLVNLVFGLWLLCALAPHWTRLGTILWYGVLGAVSLTNALVIGSETCGCFGAARIPPGPVALLDASIVLALWLCCDRDSIRAPRRPVARFLVFLAAAAAGVGLASVSIANYSPAAQRVFMLAPQLYDERSYQPAEHDLTIVNATNNVVRFDDKIVASCGCTKTNLAQQLLEPGASTTLHLAIDQRGLVGIRTVFLTLTDDTQRRWEYTVKAPAYPLIRFEPTDFYAGELSSATRYDRVAVVHTYAIGRDEPPFPNVRRIDSPNVSVEIGDSRIEAVGGVAMHRATDLHIHVTSPPEIGRQIAHVTLEYPGAEASTAPDLRVHWLVRSAFRVSPERLFLGDHRRDNERLRGTVVIRRLVLQR